MDPIHFSAEINQYICNSLTEDTHRVTMDNYKEVIEDMRDLAYEIVNELVLPYESRMNVLAEE